MASQVSLEKRNHINQCKKYKAAVSSVIRRKGKKPLLLLGFLKVCFLILLLAHHSKFFLGASVQEIL